MKRAPILNGARRRLFAQLVLNAAGQAGALFCQAALIRHAFDHLMLRDSAAPAQVLFFGTAMAAVAAASGWLQRGELIDAERLGQNYAHTVRLRLFKHLTRIEHRRLQKKRRGAVMLKFTGDLNTIRRWISHGLVRLIVSGAIILATLAALMWIAPLLSAVVALFIGAGVLINIRIGRSLRLVVGEVRRRRSQLSANINEKIARMVVVQACGRTRPEVARVRRQSSKLRNTLIERAADIGAIRGVTHGGVGMAAAAVLAIGLLEVNRGHTTPGTIAGAMAIMGFLLPALKNLGRVYEYYQDARISTQKIEAFLDTKARFRSHRGAPDLVEGPGKLEIEGITIPGVLKNVSLSIPAGSVAALTGPNGAGKSTLVALISRLLKTQKGRVLIDGQDISKVNLSSLLRAVGIVSPDLPLLAGSLEMNLRYRWPDCSIEELERVKTICGIEEIERRMRRRKQARIHEGGINLSAGERQRIMLARALLGTPRILLLDEVDAHFDADSRKLLDNIVGTYPGTILWVNHRLDSPIRADAVWKVERGYIGRLDRNETGESPG